MHGNQTQSKQQLTQATLASFYHISRPRALSQGRCFPNQQFLSITMAYQYQSSYRIIVVHLIVQQFSFLQRQSFRLSSSHAANFSAWSVQKRHACGVATRGGSAALSTLAMTYNVEVVRTHVLVTVDKRKTSPVRRSTTRIDRASPNKKGTKITHVKHVQRCNNSSQPCQCLPCAISLDPHHTTRKNER